MSKSNGRHSGRNRKKILVWIFSIIIIITIAGYTAFQVSPWPSVLLIRYAFNKGGKELSEALEKHVPPGISSQLNLQYKLNDDDAYLDVYYPTEIEDTQKSLPTIVWVHGGGWVSGSKEQVANYCKILAGKGYTVVAVDYSVAPGHIYPTPVRQVNEALSYLVKNAARLHIDPSHIFLAGDSGGSHIASQVANIICVPSYSQAMGIKPLIERSRLKGLILFCGAYDIGLVKLKGPYKSFLNTVLWSYTGTKDFMNDPALVQASVINYVTPAFPPTFISAGNADPLEVQSQAFASKLASKGVYVDSLFFPANYSPSLPHEYQFNLDVDAGRLALDQLIKFLSTEPAIKENATLRNVPSDEKSGSL